MGRFLGLFQESFAVGLGHVVGDAFELGFELFAGLVQFFVASLVVGGDLGQLAVGGLPLVPYLFQPLSGRVALFSGFAELPVAFVELGAQLGHLVREPAASRSTTGEASSPQGQDQGDHQGHDDNGQNDFHRPVILGTLGDTLRCDRGPRVGRRSPASALPACRVACAKDRKLRGRASIFTPR